MSTYEESVVIKRPVEQVFDYMDDIEREPEWQPNLRQVKQTPAGPAGVGTERHYVSEFMGRRFRNTYVNTAYEPRRRIAYRTTRTSDVQAEGEIEWRAIDAGTEVTMRVTPQVPGFLRLLPRGARERLFTGELRTTLARLKGRLEA